MQTCEIQPDALSYAASGMPTGSSVRALRLKRGGLWASEPKPGHLKIGCVTGSVWVTQVGQPGDIELTPGEVCLTHELGKVVVCCLKDALLLVDDRYTRQP